MFYHVLGIRQILEGHPVPELFGCLVGLVVGLAGAIGRERPGRDSRKKEAARDGLWGLCSWWLGEGLVWTWSNFPSLGVGSGPVLGIPEKRN